MIHHHPQGHSDKHLQFELNSGQMVIRIFLEKLDQSDYENCIKGFLSMSQDLIETEKKANNIGGDLQFYFFNEKISELIPYKSYLLKQVKLAFENQKIINDDGSVVDVKYLETLKDDPALLPFFNWESK